MWEYDFVVVASRRTEESTEILIVRQGDKGLIYVKSLPQNLLGFWNFGPFDTRGISKSHRGSSTDNASLRPNIPSIPACSTEHLLPLPAYHDYLNAHQSTNTMKRFLSPFPHLVRPSLHDAAFLMLLVQAEARTP